MALFTVVAMAGILAGIRLVRFIPQNALQRAFAVFLLVMGSFILYQNRGALLPGPTSPQAAVSVQGAH